MFRPIVSSIGTYNYKLVRFLGELLNPIIPSQHCTTESFSFCYEIQELSAFNKFMISYDAYNSFTNIPLKGYLRYKIIFCYKVALDMYLMHFFI